MSLGRLFFFPPASIEPEIFFCAAIDTYNIWPGGFFLDVGGGVMDRMADLISSLLSTGRKINAQYALRNDLKGEERQTLGVERKDCAESKERSASKNKFLFSSFHWIPGCTRAQ